MRKPRLQQVWQAVGCFLCLAITFGNTKDAVGTEFEGGYITGPLLSMAWVGIPLFVLVLALTFWYPRIAAAIGIAASLLCLPIHLYFIAPVPFAEIFAPGHEFKGYMSPGFHWEKWTVIALFALVVTSLLCVRAVVAREQK
jgi:hypothetical protein